jgi:beta-lactamase superfamily II metal-dependent hydrolase
MTKLNSLLFILFVLVTGIASAQITSATLSGKVTDGDLPISNASITIIHLPTNASFDTTTDKKGRFSLDNLDVGGPYKLVVKSNEIAEYKRTGIQLVLGDNEMIKDIIVDRKEANTNDASKTEGGATMQ